MIKIAFKKVDESPDLLLVEVEKDGKSINAGNWVEKNGYVLLELDVTDLAESKDVYIAWQNSDGNEGRGFNYPLAICESKVTAERLGKGKYVMGTDCPVEKDKVYYINGYWYGRCWVKEPSDDDKAIQDRIDAERIRREARDAILKKAKELGLTEAEINILRMEKTK